MAGGLTCRAVLLGRCGGSCVHRGRAGAVVSQGSPVSNRAWPVLSLARGGWGSATSRRSRCLRRLWGRLQLVRRRGGGRRYRGLLRSLRGRLSWLRCQRRACWLRGDLLAAIGVSMWRPLQQKQGPCSMQHLAAYKKSEDCAARRGFHRSLW